MIPKLIEAVPLMMNIQNKNMALTNGRDNKIQYSVMTGI